MAGIPAMQETARKARTGEKRRGDRRRDYKKAEAWHRNSRGGVVVERRRTIRRQEDVERFQHLAWYRDEPNRKEGVRQIILDRVSLLLRNEGDKKVVDLSGELCHVDHTEVREIFDDVSRQGHPEVVVNLASLRHVDSAGLGLLIGLRLSQRQRKGSVRLTGVNGDIYRTLMSCRLQKIFSIDNP